MTLCSPKDYFTAATFPTNLPTIFDAQWGFAEKLTGRAVVIGEWGGNIGAHGVTGDVRHPLH